jgi:hypothetical protein
MGKLGCLAQACLAYVSLSLFFLLPCEVVLARVFYSSRLGSYNES